MRKLMEEKLRRKEIYFPLNKMIELIVFGHLFKGKVIVIPIW
jgi:hypothetical protein